jgi:asparagine synthase (glutamine-hydrolysing)
VVVDKLGRFCVVHGGQGSIQVFLSTGERVARETGVAWVSGAAYINEKLLAGVSLAEHIIGLPSWSEFESCIHEASGFFSIVRVSQDSVWLAVDILRSRPLFYASENGTLMVSDVPDRILERINGLDLDSISGGELALAGFVTGQHTLDKRIHQVPAGEILRVELQEGGRHAVSTPYFSFLPSRKRNIPRNDTMVVLQEVFRTAIDRLCEYADNRTIAVPLSGGLDSRLICLGLKEAGYPHVTTFTYGVPGNDESTISRCVAEALSLPWNFVAYSGDSWRAVYESPIFDDYCRFAERLVSTPHAQDWLAVQLLLDDGVIEPDTVICPGLLGSFVSGTQFSISHDRFRFPRKCIDLRRMLWQSYYGLMPPHIAARALSVGEEELRTGIHARLDAQVEGLVDEYGSCSFSILQAWDGKYLQSNFLMNSVRAYEFFGLDWWVPLADRAFVDYWRAAPEEDLLGQSLYLRFLELMQKRLGVGIPLHSHVAERMSPRAQAKGTLILRTRQSRMGSLGLAAWRTLKKVHEREYEGHPLAWYGVVDFETFRGLLGSGGNINTIMASRQLGRRVEQAGGNPGQQGW